MNAQGQGAKAVGVIAGWIDDGGFIESGYRGLIDARDRFGLELQLVDQVGVEVRPLAQAVRSAAAGAPDLLVVHGGKSDRVCELVAPEFPDVRFLSTFGCVAGDNFSSYGVAQYESAFLAGALAGLLTNGNVVGHLSGIRIGPGLRSRAAFAHGLHRANPRATLLTCFCGTQDDPDAAHRAAIAEIEHGADIIFTMLNRGRAGAIKACRERAVPQIGNVRDWHAEMPDVFVASAVADTGRAVFLWIQDVLSGRLSHGIVRTIGIEDATVVNLALGRSIATDIRTYIDSLTEDVRLGRVPIAESYDGPELAF